MLATTELPLRMDPGSVPIAWAARCGWDSVIESHDSVIAQHTDVQLCRTFTLAGIPKAGAGSEMASSLERSEGRRGDVSIS